MKRRDDALRDTLLPADAYVAITRRHALPKMRAGAARRY